MFRCTGKRLMFHCQASVIKTYITTNNIHKRSKLPDLKCPFFRQFKSHLILKIPIYQKIPCELIAGYFYMVRIHIITFTVTVKDFPPAMVTVTSVFPALIGVITPMELTPITVVS